MIQKIYHGNFSPEDLASIIEVNFNRGNIEVRKIGSDNRVIIQIRSKNTAKSGGQTAIGITFQQYADGVIVSVGEQQWLGVAASLGFSALAALKNPFSLLHRIDDIAQDIEYINLEDEIWSVLETNIHTIGSGYQLSDKLKRLSCEYCHTANLVGSPSCAACGAPMGDIQPKTCKFCGYILYKNELRCPNCKKVQ